MSNKYDIVIIGAGLGGLLCGSILSREGFKVCLLEQNREIGGSIQSFVRNKTVFNTGLNYTESLGEGEILNRYFSYFGILDQLSIRQMNKEGFERISFANDPKEYPFAQGYKPFVESLSAYFPKEKENLQRYVNDLQKIAASFPLYNLGEIEKPINEKYLTTGAYHYLKSITSDKKLQAILAGMNSLYAGEKEKTPLYVHALINNSFIKSSWQMVGGSNQLSFALAQTIEQNGGKILTTQKAVKITGKNGIVNCVETQTGESFFADKIISNLHPAATLNLVEENLNKKAHKARIDQLANTVGMFSLYLTLKPNSFPYLDYNHHFFSQTNAWTADEQNSSMPSHYMLYTPPQTQNDSHAKGIIIITYMPYNQVVRWENTFVEKRGKEYRLFKEQKAQELLNLVEQKLPNLRQKIHKIYSSTPLTYRDYTGTPKGSAYGIIKDFNNPIGCTISPKSRIKNLYFTGQNLNMHGILGVTINSVVTCGSILGNKYLIDKIKKH